MSHDSANPKDQEDEEIVEQNTRIIVIDSTCNYQLLLFMDWVQLRKRNFLNKTIRVKTIDSKNQPARRNGYAANGIKIKLYFNYSRSRLNIISHSVYHKQLGA